MGYKIVNANKIFNYYKNKYDLKTTLQTKFCQAKLNANAESSFNFDNDIIKWTIYTTKNNKIDALNLTSLVVGFDIKLDIEKGNLFTLLHEIKHAIDYTKNKKVFMKEIYKMWIKTVDEQRNSPLQKSANKFAAKELNKWDIK